MQKLLQQDWIDLDNLMEQVPDPNTTYTVTGWHYQLSAFLGRLGYGHIGRFDAYKLAAKLLEMGYDYA